MARNAILVLSLTLIILPGPTMAWDGLDIPDLRGTWVLEMSTLDGKSLPTRDIEITSYDDTTGEYSGESRQDGGGSSLTLSGIRANEQTSLRIDDVTGGSWWEVRGVFHFDPRLTISGGYTQDRENLGDGDIDGIFEMRLKKAAAVELTGPESAAPATATLPALLGDWLLTASPAIPGVGARETWRIYVFDQETGTFAARIGEYEEETALWTATATGDRLVGSVDRRTITGGWDEMEARIVTEPSLAIVGTYVSHRDLEAGMPGTFEMRPLGEAGAAEPAAASDDATTLEPGSTEAAAPHTAGTVTPPAADGLAPVCDLSRIEAAKVALETDTPYAYTLAMNTYRGQADELFLDLLVSDRVQDPTTWDRVTTIPDEDGWTVFETRRLGDEVWQRLDGGAWTAEPPDEDVLGMPWPLDLIGRQLLPGGQAEDPALISGWAGQECVVSLLFRTEDGGKGEGRMARLVFIGDEVLPRSIEFLRTLAPTGTSKKARGASRPGAVYSLIATIRPGHVEPIRPPAEANSAS